MNTKFGTHRLSSFITTTQIFQHVGLSVFFLQDFKVDRVGYSRTKCQILHWNCIERGRVDNHLCAIMSQIATAGNFCTPPQDFLFQRLAQILRTKLLHLHDPFMNRAHSQKKLSTQKVSFLHETSGNGHFSMNSYGY